MWRRKVICELSFPTGMYVGRYSAQDTVSRHIYTRRTSVQRMVQLFKGTHLLTKDSNAWKQYSLNSSSSTLQYRTIRGIIFSRCSPGKDKVSSGKQCQPPATSFTCLAQHPPLGSLRPREPSKEPAAHQQAALQGFSETTLALQS